jgi:hypothetical protein
MAEVRGRFDRLSGLQGGDLPGCMLVRHPTTRSALGHTVGPQPTERRAPALESRPPCHTADRSGVLVELEQLEGVFVSGVMTGPGATPCGLSRRLHHGGRTRCGGGACPGSPGPVSDGPVTPEHAA